MSIGDFLSSFFTTVHNEADEKPADDAPADEASTEQPEEEEPEPEDAHPAIREECLASKDCAPMKHHFDKCQEKVQAGKGHKGEDCVEEMFHLMHCSEACAAPKVFSKLK
ncbi:Non-heme 11 kDa protein of cytochrome bc1 complex [Mycena amicta]|nr:Non-heme 11 kDa protein of cytochrome bc1 complex [Mycena amicta]